jgi:hypothetical protein
MLQQALVVFVNIRGYLDRVQSSAAAFLLDMGAESQCLCPAARILALVAAVLELWLLGMISAMKKLTPYKVTLADGALQGNKPRPDLPVYVLPFDVLLVVHVLDEPI